MITLHAFGPFFGLPDGSPFVMKAEVLLKMSGIPFQRASGDLRKAPKGKIPFIDDDGKILGDSTLIRFHLEEKHGVNFDKGLTEQEKGVAWAVEKMLEDHLYWIIVQERWLQDGNFAKGPAQFFKPIPGFIRPAVMRMVRRKIRQTLHLHGLGRHSPDEVKAIAKRAIDAIAQVLGDKPYLTGANKCGADATVFAFVAGVLTPFFESALQPMAERHPNLVAYRDRLMKEFYPDFRSP